MVTRDETSGHCQALRPKQNGVVRTKDVIWYCMSPEQTVVHTCAGVITIRKACMISPRHLRLFLAVLTRSKSNNHHFGLWRCCGDKV